MSEKTDLVERARREAIEYGFDPVCYLIEDLTDEIEKLRHEVWLLKASAPARQYE
jgi:hypothetical protein